MLFFFLLKSINLQVTQSIMDLSINKIHHILLDAALPSTIEDLKNPTEDYIMNLLKAFLSQFNIDVNLIYQVRDFINY